MKDSIRDTRKSVLDVTKMNATTRNDEFIRQKHNMNKTICEAQLKLRQCQDESVRRRQTLPPEGSS